MVLTCRSENTFLKLLLIFHHTGSGLGLRSLASTFPTSPSILDPGTWQEFRNFCYTRTSLYYCCTLISDISNFIGRSL